MAWKYNTGGVVQEQAGNPWGFGEQVKGAAEEGKEKIKKVIGMAAGVPIAKNGGRIVGPSHDDGGVKVKVNNGMLDQLEAEGGEFIASKGAMKFAGPLIEWANYVGNELYPETNASTRSERNFLEEPLMEIGGQIQAQGSSPWGLSQQVTSAAAKGKKEKEPSVSTDEPSDIGSDVDIDVSNELDVITPVEELSQDNTGINVAIGRYNYGGEIPKYQTGNAVVSQAEAANPWNFGSSIQNALMMRELREPSGQYGWMGEPPKEEEEEGWFSKIKGALGDYKSKRANTKRLEKESREQSFQTGLQDQKLKVAQEKIDRKRGFSDTPGKTVNRKYQLADTQYEYDEKTDSVTEVKGPTYGSREEQLAQNQELLQSQGEALLDKQDADKKRVAEAESDLSSSMKGITNKWKDYSDKQAAETKAYNAKSTIASRQGEADDKSRSERLLADSQAGTKQMEASLARLEKFTSGNMSDQEKTQMAHHASNPEFKSDKKFLIDENQTWGSPVGSGKPAAPGYNFSEKQKEGWDKYLADFDTREDAREMLAERKKYDKKTGQTAWDVEAKKQGLSWFDDREAWQKGKDKFEGNVPTESGYRQITAEEVMPMPTTGEDYHLQSVNRPADQPIVNPYEAQLNEAFEQNRTNEERPSLDQMIQMSEDKRNLALREKYDVNMMEDNRTSYPQKPGVLKSLRQTFSKYEEGGPIQQGGGTEQFTFPSNTGNNIGLLNANVLSNMSNKGRMNNIREYVAEINQQSPMFIDTILSR